MLRAAGTKRRAARFPVMSDQHIRTRNPATGEILDHHPLLGADTIDHRLALAERGQRAWAKTDLAERGALLTAIADAFSARRDDLARMVTAEMGKTLGSAEAETDKCIAAFRHYAEAGPAMLGAQTFDLGDAGTATAEWHPLGPVLAVMPWNFPLWQVVRPLAPTILAGNAMLLKHASITMGTAELMAEVVRDAGAPEGLFQNLVIRSNAVADIIADPRVKAVTLTGSEAAGRAVAETAGRHLKKVVLELGGSDPFVVMPSADLDAAVAQAVKARIQNTGQSCICGKRMIVHADIFDRFHDAFAAALRAVAWGDPLDPATDMGPLSSFEQRETVLDQLEAIRGAGGTVEFGGEAVGERGAYMDAGLVTGLDPASEVMAEEIFGPVAMLFEARDADEAIRIANAIPYGLGASVWTRDTDEEARFIAGIEAGMVAVNQMLSSHPKAPFGGVKNSGHGRELGPFGLHEFMNLKTLFRPR